MATPETTASPATPAESPAASTTARDPSATTSAGPGESLATPAVPPAASATTPTATAAPQAASSAPQIASAAPAATSTVPPTYTAVSRSPISFFSNGQQIYVPLSVITFTNGAVNFPFSVVANRSTITVTSAPTDPLGSWISHLVKVGVIKPGPPVPANATKA